MHRFCYLTLNSNIRMVSFSWEYTIVKPVKLENCVRNHLFDKNTVVLFWTVQFSIFQTLSKHHLPKWVYDHLVKNCKNDRKPILDQNPRRGLSEKVHSKKLTTYRRTDEGQSWKKIFTYNRSYTRTRHLNLSALLVGSATYINVRLFV